MPSPTGAAGRTGRLTALYVSIWGVLAIGAAIYLAGLAFRGEILALLTRAATQGPERDSAVMKAVTAVEGLGRSIADLRSEVGHVKDTLARHEDQIRELPTLQSEVGDIKTALSEQEERQRNLSGRLAAFEAQAMAHAAATQAAATQQPVANNRSVPERIVTGSVDDRTSPAARPSVNEMKLPARKPAEHKPAAVQQHASAAAVPPFGPAKVVSLAGPVALQIGTGSSPDDLRLKWLRATTAGGDVLQRFEPRYAEAKRGNKVFYRLLVGPIANTDDAGRLCTQLKAHKVSCFVTATSGQPL